MESRWQLGHIFNMLKEKQTDKQVVNPEFETLGKCISKNKEK